MWHFSFFFLVVRRINVINIIWSHFCICKTGFFHYLCNVIKEGILNKFMLDWLKFSLPQQLFWYSILGAKKVSQQNRIFLLYSICEIDMLLTNCKAPIIPFCLKFKGERIKETVFIFQCNHERPRARCVHCLSGAASDVWWHEAGRGGNGALHHSPLLKPQEPHSPTWSHLPGHATKSIPSQILSSVDQRVSSPFHVCPTRHYPEDVCLLKGRMLFVWWGFICCCYLAQCTTYLNRNY